MFSYTQPSAFSYSQPRDKYFAAVAAAKAAEADYLAAEAVRTEEEALYARLQELQQRKHALNNIQPQFSAAPYYGAMPVQQLNPNTGGRHMPSFCHPFNDAQLLHQQWEEQRRSFLQQEAATANLTSAYNPLLGNYPDFLQRSSVRSCPFHYLQQIVLITFPTKVLHSHMRPSLYPAQNVLHGGEAMLQPAYMNLAPPPVNVSIKPNSMKKPFASQTAAPEANDSEKLLSLMSQLEARILAERKANNTVGQSDLSDFERFFQYMGAAPEQATRLKTPKVKFTLPIYPTTSHRITRQAQALTQATSAGESLKCNTHVVPQPSNIPNAGTGGPKSDEEHILRIVYGIPPPAYLQEKKPTEVSISSPFSFNCEIDPMSKVKSTPSTPAKSTTATAKPVPDAQTLKQQLEARLGNEHANEIRDTIQAILVSISDTGASAVQQPTAGGSTFTVRQPTASGSDKGKAKLSIAPTSEVQPTSKDVANSIETIRNIEAAFLSLDSEFVFPAALDFSSSSSPSSPSSDSESTSVASRLAYTSRNQPLRFYEQALSALLSQLDGVQSYGNEVLRSRRKEVVGRVERALEELEREIEGRLKVRTAKEVKTPSSDLVPTTSVATEAAFSPEAAIAVTSNTTEIDSSSASQPTEADIDLGAVSSDVVAHETLAKLEEPAASYASSVPAPSTDSPVFVHMSEEADSIQVVPGTQVNSSPDLHPTVTQPIVAQQEEDLAVSEVTVRPYDVTTRVDHSEVTEPFLLQSSHSEVIRKKAAHHDHDGDTGSDWSEVEA